MDKPSPNPSLGTATHLAVCGVDGDCIGALHLHVRTKKCNTNVSTERNRNDKLCVQSTYVHCSSPRFPHHHRKRPRSARVRLLSVVAPTTPDRFGRLEIELITRRKPGPHPLNSRRQTTHSKPHRQSQCGSPRGSFPPHATTPAYRRARLYLAPVNVDAQHERFRHPVAATVGWRRPAGQDKASIALKWPSRFVRFCRQGLWKLRISLFCTARFSDPYRALRAEA